MSKREIALVFGNIEALVPVNESILRELEKRQRDDEGLVKFSDAFLSSVGNIHTHLFLLLSHQKKFLD